MKKLIVSLLTTWFIMAMVCWLLHLLHGGRYHLESFISVALFISYFMLREYEKGKGTLQISSPKLRILLIIGIIWLFSAICIWLARLFWGAEDIDSTWLVTVIVLTPVIVYLEIQKEKTDE